MHGRRNIAWQQAVTIAAEHEALPVVHCPSWLARSGLPTLFGSVVDMLGQGYAFWASAVETFYCREQKSEEAHRYRGRATHLVWWRTTEPRLFGTLPCFGGMKQRSFSVSPEVCAAQTPWHDS